MTETPNHFATFKVAIEALFTSRRETVYANAAAREFLARLTSVAQPLVIKLGGSKLQRYSLPQETADMPPQLQAGAILEYVCDSFDSWDEGADDHGRGALADEIEQLKAKAVELDEERQRETKRANQAISNSNELLQRVKKAEQNLRGERSRGDGYMQAAHKVDDHWIAERERVASLTKALAPLIDIADAYDANELDDEARKRWGKNYEHENDRAPTDIELYSGRGGRQLLTLEHCRAARRAVKGG